ncbi:MAG: histidine phosphatase family protein [Spirochaetota bacterium]
MKLYLVRHADPDYENDTITGRGIDEGIALGKRAGSLGLTALFSSPMGRAQKTARFISDGCGLEPVILDWAAELNSLYTETPFGYRPVWDIPPEFYLEPEKISGRKSPHLSNDMPIHGEVLSVLKTVGKKFGCLFQRLRLPP